MRKKTVVISIIFVVLILLLTCSAYAANVLLISEEENVNGTEVATMMGKIAPGECNMTEVSLASGKSLEQTINEFDTTGKSFDSVIIQLPYEDAVLKDSSANTISAINSLYAKIKKDTGTKVFVGTPVGKIANYETEITSSQESVKKIIDGLATINASSIPVYENLGTATNKSLAVFMNGKTTTLGNLLVACTYCNSLGNPVVGLTSYDKLLDADVKGIVEISNVATTPKTDSTTEELIDDATNKDDNDQADIDGDDVISINREPIMEISGSDSKELVIRVYDKENAGLKSVSLMINDANGDKIEQEKEVSTADTKEETKEENKEETKNQNCIFKINREKYLDKQEYKQFYIYAEDNDGCILKEFFRVKYIETAENGCYYKINRAPRIRPKLGVQTNEKEVNTISLHVMDQTGVQKVTPMSVEENGLKAVNLFADGKYNGYDGIEGNYDWQDIKSKTSTSSKVYIKEAYTKEQNIEEFFKYEETTEKVSLLLADKKFRFNTHAVDATGLAADRVMIVDFSGKDEDTSGNTTSDDTTNASTPSASNSSAAQKTSSTSKAEEKGTLKDTNGSYSGYEFRAFKADREPRLKYFPKSDYLYIEIRDCSGVACEYPSGEGNEKREANKSLQPQIYYYKNDKRGSVVPNLKRPTEGEYKKEKETYEFVYTIGLPVKEIGTEYTKFEIVARDVPSHTKLKTQTYIDEVFMVKKSSDGKIIVDRAPVVHIVGLMSNYKLMSAHAMDWTGVSKVELKSLPKSSGQQGDIIRSWNGAVQSNWSLIASCTKNKKYATNALSKFEKIDTVFSKSNWKGLNPKISGEDGVYQVEISAADASGAKSTKIMIVDIKRWVKNHDEWGETGNATQKSSSKASSTKKSSSNKSTKSTEKSSSSKSSSKSKKTEEKTSKGKNSKSKNSGESSGGSSKKTSGLERELKRKMSGDDVKKLQERLIHFGYIRLAKDGNFGSQTEFAVMDFQTINGCKIDGSVGDQTWGKLENEQSLGTSSSKSKGGKSDKSMYVCYASRDKENVKALKRRLIYLGYGKKDNLKPDNGEYNKETSSAVEKFQKQNSIEKQTYGVVDDKTLDKLNSTEAQKFDATKVANSSGSSGSSGKTQKEEVYPKSIKIKFAPEYANQSKVVSAKNPIKLTVEFYSGEKDSSGKKEKEVTVKKVKWDIIQEDDKNWTWGKWKLKGAPYVEVTNGGMVKLTKSPPKKSGNLGIVVRARAPKDKNDKEYTIVDTFMTTIYGE